MPIGALAVLVSISVLGGCSAPDAPAPAPSPSPSLTQEQQDDRAFLDLFSRYVDLEPDQETDEILSGMLTGDALDGETSSIRDTAAKGQHGEGRATMSGFQVTSHGTDADGSDFMVGQACLDVGGTRILDGSGQDVTPPRATRLSLQMKATRSADGTWRISDSLRNEEVHACG